MQEVLLGELIYRHQAERYSKGFSCWDHFVAILFRKYLQFKSQVSWSLSNLVALFRWNLFTYRNLWAWIDDPFQVPPTEPGSV